MAVAGKGGGRKEGGGRGKPPRTPPRRRRGVALRVKIVASRRRLSFRRRRVRVVDVRARDGGGVRRCASASRGGRVRRRDRVRGNVLGPLGRGDGRFTIDELDARRWEIRSALNLRVDDDAEGLPPSAVNVGDRVAVAIIPDDDDDSPELVGTDEETATRAFEAECEVRALNPRGVR